MHTGRTEAWPGLCYLATVSANMSLVIMLPTELLCFSEIIYSCHKQEINWLMRGESVLFCYGFLVTCVFLVASKYLKSIGNKSHIEQ